MRTPPPTNRHRGPKACKRFGAKVRALHGAPDETAWLNSIGLNKNLLKNLIDKDARIPLDHAWLIARKLNLSLDDLADDEHTGMPGELVSEPMRMVIYHARRLGWDVVIDRILRKDLEGEEVNPDLEADEIQATKTIDQLMKPRKPRKKETKPRKSRKKKTDG